MKRIFLGIVFLLFLVSCSQSKIENVERAFYYWKGNSSLNKDEILNLKSQKVKKLYVKVFEVDYSEVRGNFPYEKNRISFYDVNELDSINFIPTIFIKNGIFQYNDEKSLDQLADNIVYLVDRYSKREYDYKDPIFNYNEIQIDCDWTKSTKDKYFYLLKKIKEISKKEISCTLRLYPYKYPDIMGVPPVDKATLMCYNIIKPLEKKDKNSILDLDELKKYLDKKKSYPLHLDIALPVFYWTQLYQNNQFVKLLEISSKDVKTFAKEIKPLWYEVKKDSSFDYGRDFLKIGDQIKCEEISAETILEAISIIKKNVDFDQNTTICLFDLDSGTFKQYSNEEISNFYDSFIK